ncbi:YibE/F family protein [Pengzhenrongella frigida]|uniref:YibE/F family protein n=2 Tax=Pengzhenrongella frigida TaxID=1259133 RepID=A0A4Q5MX00_9MICO|nr:YibE/F family protein [Cellulomonas sp. HLT2-17]
MIALWPSGDSATHGEIVAVDTEYPAARVTGTAAERCESSSEDRLADGTIPAQVDCLRVQAVVSSGTGKGQAVEVWATAGLRAQDVPIGTRITLEHYGATAGEAEAWAWHDFARTLPLLVLAAAFAAVTIAVARMRGLRALIGLALSFVVIASFMLPALLAGENALLVGLVGSTVIMYVVLYLAHGLSRRTSTALLGTMAGLGVTAGLGVIAASAAHITGVTSEDSFRLASLLGQSDSTALRGIFLCGVVLAGLGVLNDVTITQASAVWELRSADPEATRRDLFTQAMRIGRDHIASTVYTIAFAYAGASLPLLLLVEVYQLPLVQTLTSGEFAGEIVRTLVGSIGLVLAIPLTTAIAALVVTADPQGALRRRHRETVPLAHHH